MGFVHLFDVVGQFLIKPHFLRDINEEYFTCALEEECLRRRLKQTQRTGKFYVSPAPMSIYEVPAHDDEFKLPRGILRLRNGELQSGLGVMLSEVEERRKKLGNKRVICCVNLLVKPVLHPDKQRQTSSLRRNVVYPVAMLLLLGLTIIAVLLVLQNTVSLLIGVKALPLSSKVSQTFTKVSIT